MDTIRIGIFIGINDYAVKPLKGARQDAERMCKFFESKKYDITVPLLDENASRANVLEMVKIICDECREIVNKGKDAKIMLLFFFSGHGDSSAGRQYLQLVDGSEIDINEIERMTRITRVQRVFILDCCRIRDQGILRQLKVIFDQWLVGGQNFYEKGVTSPVLLTACDQGQLAWDDEIEQCGVFTKALLSTLRKRKVNTLASLNDEFQKELIKLGSEQTPILKVPLGVEVKLLASWNDSSIKNSSASIKKENGKPFIMEIEQIFSPQKGCKVVIGKIKGGIMRMNDNVEIIGNGCSVNTVVTGIELYDKKGNSKGLFDEAHPGDWAGCLLKKARNLTKVKEGCVLRKDM